MDDAHELMDVLLAAWSWLEAWEYHASRLSLHTLAGHLWLELAADMRLDLELQLQVEAEAALVPIDSLECRIPLLQACIRDEPNLALRASTIALCS